MSPDLARRLADAGYNDSPAARAERAGVNMKQWLRPAVPVSPERERRCFERKRPTPDDRRAWMRNDIAACNRALADPEKAWRHDDIERARRHHVLRYRLAISVMQALPALPFPSEDEIAFAMAAE